MSDDTPKSAMGLILDGMPASVKAVLFSILAIPLMVSLSAMVLQLNAGKLIEQYMEYNRSSQQQELAHLATIADVVEQNPTFAQDAINAAKSTDKLQEQIAGLRQDLAVVHELAASVTNNSAQVGALADEMQRLGANMDTFKALPTQLALMADEILALNTRVAWLSDRATAGQSDTSGLRAEIDGLKLRFDALKQWVCRHGNDDHSELGC